MKVLIVDDSETVRVQLRRDLETKDYQVVEAVDGVDGLDVLNANADVKLLITDVNMPRMDGLAMVKKIREFPAFASLPVLVMTTELSPDLKAKGKEAGVLAWVTKPYVAEKLLQVLGKIINK